MDYPKTVPGVSLLNGKFTDGDEINNVPASLDPASWANSVTEELLNIIRAASITPNEKKYDQVLKAIQKLIANAMPNIPDVSGFIQGFSPVPVRYIAARQSNTPGDHGVVNHSVFLNNEEITSTHNNSPKYALLNVRARCQIHVSENGHQYLNTRSICKVSNHRQYCSAEQGLDPTYSKHGFLPEMMQEDNTMFIVPVVANKVAFDGQLVLFRDHAGVIRAPGSGYFAYVGYNVYMLGVG